MAFAAEKPNKPLTPAIEPLTPQPSESGSPQLRPNLTAPKTASEVLEEASPQSREKLSSEEALKGKLVYETNRYLLGPGDILSVNVLLEPDYSQESVLIGPDGRASIIGIGDIDMKDRTIEDVSQEITTRLKRIIKSPNVNLALKRTRPGIVYIAGAVMHPGMFQMVTSSDPMGLDVSAKEPLSRTEMRLSNVLANTGGVMPSADLTQVQVKRARTGEVETVNLWKMLKEAAYEQDVQIDYGDGIFIPHNQQMALSDEDYKTLLSSSIGPKTFPIRVLGEVEKPGIYELDATSPLLNSAIGKAGGMSPEASKEVVAVRRFTSETTFNTFFVEPDKLDIVLRPNDVVYIPETKLYKAGRVGSEIARILLPFTSVASVAAYSAQVFAFGGWRRVSF